MPFGSLSRAKRNGSDLVRLFSTARKERKHQKIEKSKGRLCAYSVLTSWVHAPSSFNLQHCTLNIRVPSRGIMPDRLFPAERLGGLLDILADGTISNQTAKSLLREMVLVSVAPPAASGERKRECWHRFDRWARAAGKRRKEGATHFTCGTVGGPFHGFRFNSWVGYSTRGWAIRLVLHTPHERRRQQELGHTWSTQARVCAS